MKTSHILAFCLSIFAVSCASKDPPIPKAFVVQKEVPVQARVAPTVAKLRESAAQADTVAAESRVKVEQVDKDAASLEGKLVAAVDEADRLRKAGAATREELTDLWGKLVSARDEIWSLKRSLTSAIQSLEAERQLRLKAAADLAAAEDAAHKKDAETEGLRMQWADEIAGAKKNAEGLETAIKQREAEKSRADRLEGRIWIYDRIAIGFAIMAVIAILWWVFKPRIRP